MIAVASIALSTSVFAGTNLVKSETEFRTEGYATQAQAYEAGFDIADEMKLASNGQLKFQLPTTSKGNVQKVSIEGVEVSLEEFSAQRGEVKYRAIVDVDYSYTVKQSNDS
ncbi:DUF3316 domain-containing protein [Vibrio algarum]|uniref:DUF3316 domain-containing protein n=1 Tax=Vibrio algarum TaxID=3020714 RepID=A0ABT4YVW1_9VIBR|nr:DUF3316 domain-containing protein [Vibrio sp. KJ40-1]MDB1125520.1 DUF3316 domain-containing protein [Vibrio sp. KJ40-1]